MNVRQKQMKKIRKKTKYFNYFHGKNEKQILTFVLPKIN